MSSNEGQERRDIEAERAAAEVMTGFYNTLDNLSVESDYIFDKFPRNERLIPQEFEGLSRAQAVDKMVPELSKLDLNDTRSKQLAKPVLTQFPELLARIKIYQESLASSQPDPKQVLQQKIEQIETTFKRKGLTGPVYINGLKELNRDKETLADADPVQIKGLEEKYEGAPQQHVERLSKGAKKVEVVDAPGAEANKRSVRRQVLTNAIVNFFKKIPENIAGLFRKNDAAPAAPPKVDRNARVSRSESFSFEDSESIESPRNSGEKPASPDFENQKGGAYDFGPEKPSAKFSSEQPSSRAVNQQARDSFASIAQHHSETSAVKRAAVASPQAEVVVRPQSPK